MPGHGPGCHAGYLGTNVIDGVGENFAADERFDRIEDFGLGHQYKIAGQTISPRAAIAQEILFAEPIEQACQAGVKRGIGQGVFD